MSARDELERVKWDNVAQHRLAERLLDAIERAAAKQDEWLSADFSNDHPAAWKAIYESHTILEDALKGEK